MAEKLPDLQTILLQYHQIKLSVNFTYLSLNKPLSRAQINYLIYSYSFSPDSIQAVKMAFFGYKIQIAYYYNRVLKNAGYLAMIKRGHYQLTEKGLHLVNTFLDHAGLLPK